MLVLTSLVFLALGVFLLLSGSGWLGIATIMLSAAGLCTALLERARPNSGPYFLLGMTIAVLGAGICAYLLIAGPPGGRYGLEGSPTMSRIVGAVGLMGCLAAIAAVTTRWRKAKVGSR